MVKLNPETQGPHTEEETSVESEQKRITERHEQATRMLSTIESALQKFQAEKDEILPLKDQREQATGIHDRALVDQINYSRENLSEIHSTGIDEVQTLIDQLQEELGAIDQDEDIPDDLYRQLTVVGNTFSNQDSLSAEDPTLSTLDSKLARIANGFGGQLEQKAELQQQRDTHRTELLTKLANYDKISFLKPDMISGIMERINDPESSQQTEKLRNVIDQMADRYDRVKIAANNTDALLDLLQHEDSRTAEDVHRVYSQILEDYGNPLTEGRPVHSDKLEAAGYSLKDINDLYRRKIQQESGNSTQVTAPKLTPTIDGFGPDRDAANKHMKELTAQLRKEVESLV